MTKFRNKNSLGSVSVSLNQLAPSIPEANQVNL